MEDEVIRMARAGRGLREEPRATKRAEVEPTPADIRDLIAKFQSPASQEWMEAQARQMHATGAPWEEVRRVLRAKLEA